MGDFTYWLSCLDKLFNIIEPQFSHLEIGVNGFSNICMVSYLVPNV